MPRINLSRTAESSRFVLPATIPQGQRDNTIFRFACSLRALDVAEDELRAAVYEANATRCDPPLSDHEVEQKVRQALGYQGGHGGSLGRAPARRPERPVRVAHRQGRPERLPDMSGLSPLEQTRAWIDALFYPEDIVCLCFGTTSRFPSAEWYACAGQLLDEGDRCLEEQLARARRNIGLYGVVNPIRDIVRPVEDAADPLRDREGTRKDEHVASLRWALVECDELPPDQQLERICALLFEPEETGWKCKALTWSGGKSWHAVVYIGAETRAEYDQRVSDLYGYCDANGLPVDHACRNPARLTRVPGVMRGGQMQQLRWCDSCPTFRP